MYSYGSFGQFPCVCRRELDKNASSWGFNSPAEQPSHQDENVLPSITSKKAGAGSTIQQAQQQLQKSGKYDNVPSRVSQQQQEQCSLWNDTAAAQRAFKKEAQQRRLHQKEFHAKQSIRHRQQEYDQAVKARLAQGMQPDARSSHSRVHVSSQSKSDLPQIVPGVSGSLTVLQGPRARKLQAIARQPRAPELARPPRQISRLPDDVFLPDRTGSQSSQPAGVVGTTQYKVAESPRLTNILSTEQDESTGDVSAGLLPQLSSHRSRRLTQELGSQVSLGRAA